MHTVEMNTIVFCGTTPNIGTTVLAFGFAALLSMQRKAKVGYLCLNLKSSKLHHYLNVTPKSSLDHVLPELQADCLSGDRLESFMMRPLKDYPSLHVLFGSQHREVADKYTADDIARLMHVASSHFDWIVLDVNAYWDNAATVQGCLGANHRVCVTTGSYTDFYVDGSAWLKRIEQIYKLPIQMNHLLVSKWDEKLSIHSLMDISRSLGTAVAHPSPYLPQLPIQLARGEMPQLMKQKGFIQPLRQLEVEMLL